MTSGGKAGAAGKVAGGFIQSKLTPLLMAAAIGAGAFAVIQLPREEEPQIIVPMIDVFVAMPGASPAEVERRVTQPMESLLLEIPGVEYVYSTSGPGQSMAIVRFEVGSDEEDAILRVHDELRAHFNIIPPGASRPLVKSRRIDDVPILGLTVWSKRYGDYQLRRVAAALRDEVREVPGVSEVTLIGGQRRQVRVLVDPERLAAHQVTPLAVAHAVAAGNQKLPAGAIARDNTEYIIETGTVLRDTDDVGSIVVGASDGGPVFLRDVARIVDGGEEPSSYVRFGAGAAAGPGEAKAGAAAWPAVTLAVAKRKGENAVDVVHRLLEKVESVRADLLPDDIQLTVTRDYGETAQEKSNELLLHMGIAVVSVSFLILLILGWRESIIVLLAIPVTLALTLAVFFLYGYSLNRITLFALIFSIGILVDDAIVVVENIARHYRLPENRGKSIRDIAVRAVDEVGNPTILATMTVIAAILPMAFVRGLMGPYMRPIPVGASAAMFISLVVAFVVTPWATVRLLGRKHARDESSGDTPGDDHVRERASTRLYRRLMGALLASAPRRWGFLATVVVLLLASLATIPTKFVQVKMLPFDNKSEFQIVVDMPEGTTLETTAALTRQIAERVRAEPEVTSYQTYVGTAGPYTFNGLVRHYFLRSGAHVADITVKLLPKHDRTAQSHDIAKRVRESITPLAEAAGARVKVVEVPPGPPVLQTLVAEIYGPDYQRQIDIAASVMKKMEDMPGVVDVDWFVEARQPELRLIVDEVKAALHGVSESQIASTIALAVSGKPVGLLHAETEGEDVPLLVRLDQANRSDLDRLRALRVAGESGLVSLAELVRAEPVKHPRSIYRKNGKRVVYVTADLAGAIESPVYAMLDLAPTIEEDVLDEGYALAQHTASQPDDTTRYSLKWDGEWHITYEVFRDLGLAFAAVMILIYVLVVAWFQSFVTPLVIMSAIPFSLVGILPMHGLMGAFFTATSMIGFIAGAGIVVRNSIILVDFIQLRLAEGMPLSEAVVDAGAVRFRPMLLTAAAVVVGAAVILFDPIFEGLAISLMAGEIASLFLSRMTVPVVYYIVEKRRRKPARARVEAPRAD